MLFLTLDCGRKVALDTFEYGRTYAGLLEGRPDAAMNADIVAAALAERRRSWGECNVHLIPPAVDATDPEHSRLPPVVLRASLTCFTAVDPAFMGSDLIVGWFADECHAEPVASVVFRAVRGLAWDELARNFDW